MRKLLRKKIAKGMFYYYKGNMLWKYHAYQSNRQSKEIMLCYDIDGNESYFDNWKDAKKYIRTMPTKIETPWPEVIPEYVICNENKFTYDDIPF